MTPVAVSLVPSAAHVDPSHPEHPRRLEGLDRALRAHFGEAASFLEPKPADEDRVLAVHTREHLEFLRRACAQAPAIIDYAPTFVSPRSYECALEAVGGVLAILDAILSGGSRGGFAAVRPPGHHAPADRAMGFCLFNNIAIAARAAQAGGLQRVMIVDFDVHHGNGTQALFDADPSVLYVSSHQYGIYPGTGAAEETGSGAGRGSTVHVPLPAGAGARAFDLFDARIVQPMAERFRPEIILVSAGFDAHWRDPLAGLLWTTAGIHRMSSSLVAVAQAHCEGRVLFALEGGYDPAVVREGILAGVAAMLSRPAPLDDLGSSPEPETDASSWIDHAAQIHALSVG